MSSATYLSIALDFSVPFMLHSLCLMIGTWIFGFELQVSIRASLAPHCVWCSAGVAYLPSQISFRGSPNLVLSLSKGTQRAQTCTSLPILADGLPRRSCPKCVPGDGVAFRIRICHVPSKDILITQTVRRLPSSRISILGNKKEQLCLRTISHQLLLVG